MKFSELKVLVVAWLILSFVFGFRFALLEDFDSLSLAVVFSAIIMIVWVSAKKGVASALDADVEHELWWLHHMGFRSRDRLKFPLPLGIVLPIIISLFSIGLFKFTAFISFEPKASKYRVARRFGFYSFKEMTDLDTAFIAASGMFALILLAVVAYFLPFAGGEMLARMSLVVAFWNMLPVSKFDGAQILYGNRLLWSFLAVTITLLTAWSIILP